MKLGYGLLTALSFLIIWILCDFRLKMTIKLIDYLAWVIYLNSLLSLFLELNNWTNVIERNN